MIYSVNFLDMTEQLNPLAVCKYLEQMNWKLYPFKRKDVKVFQYTDNGVFNQVTVPMDKTFIDYKQTMYNVVQSIAEIESKSIEQIMLYLLNPNTDILKIRLDKKEIESGNILFDDAIKLYDNTKKLLAATALDIVNPKKIHYGRIDEPVQKFLSQCRFGQTEIGSYVISVVCPFGELSDKDGYKQLSIFSEEERCAQSLTRQVTNKLIDNIAFIKSQIDLGQMDLLISEENDISSNFYEALNGLNFESENSLIEFDVQWSPSVKNNRSKINHVKLTNDYYQPIASIIDEIKVNTNKQTEIIGRIKQLSALPSIDKRIGGTVVIVYISDNNKAKSMTVRLSKEDYEKAIEAHQYGKAVKVIGDVTGKSKLKMENASFYIIE